MSYATATGAQRLEVSSAAMLLYAVTALARTHFEDACIRAVRAIARPVSPFNKE